jgi:nucleoid-associated protein YgaU
MIHLERILVAATVAAVAVFLALAFAWTGEVTGSLRSRPEEAAGLESRAASGAPNAQGSIEASPSHLVRRGETLWSIAGLLLGSGSRWREIYDLNRDRVSDPTRLSEGTVLRLP